MAEPEYTTPEQMRLWLRAAFKQDPESGLLALIARSIRDPVAGADGKSRPHPLWVALVVIFVLAACVFVGFSVLRLNPE